MGLVPLIAEVINSNMFGIYYRSQKQQEERYLKGAALRKTLRRYLISTYIEWTLRVVIVLVSILQFLIITSRTGTYCAYTTGLLRFESQWL